MKNISFAIIGGGPAGFYTAKLLSKLPSRPQIHIYQKQLCPFGLIRYGVAPDHVSIKKSEIVLSEIDNYQNFNYIGNQVVDEAFIKDLQMRYSGIVYSHGANGDIKPSSDQFNGLNSISQVQSIKMARQIVYWYNNHPDYEKYKLDMTKTRDVTIIGNGNVAIDIARIFLRKPSELSATQISPNALQALKQNVVQNITIIGRRGLVQSAFALKQVRQMTKYGIKLYALKQEVQSSLNDASYEECTALGNNFSNVIRQNKRKIDFIKEKVQIIEAENLQKLKANGEKKVIFRFLLNPHSIQAKDKSVSFNKTYLIGEPFKQKCIDTDEMIEISHDLLIFSIGFQVKYIDGSLTPQNKIPNQNGCLINQSDKVQLGKYTSGWCKSGPQGVIDQTLLSCEQTFNNIRIHCKNGILPQKNKIQLQSVFNPSKNVNFEQYKKIREIELSRGDEKKYIKKKLSKKQILEIYGFSKHR